MPWETTPDGVAASSLDQALWAWTVASCLFLGAVPQAPDRLEDGAGTELPEAKGGKLGAEVRSISLAREEGVYRPNLLQP